MSNKITKNVWQFSITVPQFVARTKHLFGDRFLWKPSIAIAPSLCCFKTDEILIHNLKLARQTDAHSQTAFKLEIQMPGCMEDEKNWQLICEMMFTFNSPSLLFKLFISFWITTSFSRKLASLLFMSSCGKREKKEIGDYDVQRPTSLPLPSIICFWRPLVNPIVAQTFFLFRMFLFHHVTLSKLSWFWNNPICGLLINRMCELHWHPKHALVKWRRWLQEKLRKGSTLHICNCC